MPLTFQGGRTAIDPPAAVAGPLQDERGVASALNRHRRRGKKVLAARMKFRAERTDGFSPRHVSADRGRSVNGEVLAC
jgi:hypothetical protein